jgi:hypothetical protein
VLCDVALEVVTGCANGVAAVGTGVGSCGVNRTAVPASPSLLACDPTPVFFGFVGADPQVAEAVCLSSQGRVVFETEMEETRTVPSFSTWVRARTYEMIVVPAPGSPAASTGVTCMIRRCSSDTFQVVSEPLADGVFFASLPNGTWNADPGKPMFSTLLPPQATSSQNTQLNAATAASACLATFGDTSLGLYISVPQSSITEASLVGPDGDLAAALAVVEAASNWTFAYRAGNPPNATSLLQTQGVLTVMTDSGQRLLFYTPSLQPVSAQNHRRMRAKDVGALTFMCSVRDTTISALKVEDRVKAGNAVVAIVAVRGAQ